MAKIAIIEDEPAMRRSMRRALEADDHIVIESAEVDDALRAIEHHDADAVITDLNLTNSHGLDLVKQLRAHQFPGPIVVVTAFGNIESAVSAMQIGANDYLQKPVSLTELRIVINRELERCNLQNQLHLYERVERISDTRPPLIGKSSAWTQTVEMAERMATAPFTTDAGPAPVLITGEIGVGKRTLARHIHQSTPDHSIPFVHIKCFALSEAMLERELFGTVNESPLSARHGASPGLLEIDGRGTILLDEVAELPLAAQSRLFAVLQVQAADRSSNNSHTKSMDRIIATTTSDLEEKVRQGAFREDLFYSLNVMPLVVPPLRARPGDAAAIAEWLVANLAREFNRSRLHLADDAREGIGQHHWPGNIRELQNAVQRGAFLALDDEITTEDLGIRRKHPSPEPDADTDGRARSSLVTVRRPKTVRFDFGEGPISTEEMEAQLIVAALRRTHGNISKAAKLVCLTRSTLRYRIQRYKLEEILQEFYES